MKLATTKQFRSAVRSCVKVTPGCHTYTDSSRVNPGDKRYVKFLTWRELSDDVISNIEFVLFSNYGATANTRASRSGVVGTCVLEN
jgi:hypothetical protein